MLRRLLLVTFTLTAGAFGAVPQESKDFQRLEEMFAGGTAPTPLYFSSDSAWAGKCLLSKRPAQRLAAALDIFVMRDPVLASRQFAAISSVPGKAEDAALTRHALDMHTDHERLRAWGIERINTSLVECTEENSLCYTDSQYVDSLALKVELRSTLVESGASVLVARLSNGDTHAMCYFWKNRFDEIAHLIADPTQLAKAKIGRRVLGFRPKEIYPAGETAPAVLHRNESSPIVLPPSAP